MSQKGSNFEREMCKRLSLWWTNKARDDIFWRSDGSGARATARRKQGKSTANSCGDIAILDPLGKPLVDAITFELKRGYPRTSFADAFDASPRAKAQQWQEFLAQSYLAHREAGSRHWMLISRRNQREALCFFPWELLQELREVGAFADRPQPFGLLWVPMTKAGKGVPRKLKIIVCHFEDWLHAVRPAHIEALSG